MPFPLVGDILSRTSDLMITHYGIAVNRHEVLDIMPGGASRVVPIAQFANGKRIHLKQRPNPVNLPSIYARIRQAAANQDVYNALTYNCEHLKNFVLSGESYSESVRVLFGCMVVVGVCLFVRGRGS